MKAALFCDRGCCCDGLSSAILAEYMGPLGDIIAYDPTDAIHDPFVFAAYFFAYSAITAGNAIREDIKVCQHRTPILYNGEFPNRISKNGIHLVSVRIWPWRAVGIKEKHGRSLTHPCHP